jgi:hypothetical protein
MTKKTTSKIRVLTAIRLRSGIVRKYSLRSNPISLKPLITWNHSTKGAEHRFVQ